MNVISLEDLAHSVVQSDYFNGQVDVENVTHILNCAALRLGLFCFMTNGEVRLDVENGYHLVISTEKVKAAACGCCAT